MKKVLSFGVFDLLHAGHFNVLTGARALGDTLTVAVQDDAGVAASKGRPPVLTMEERVTQLEALPFVDRVICYSAGPGADAVALCEHERPDIIVQGDDWLHSADRTEMLGFLRRTGTRLILLPRTEHISSTEIRRRIVDGARRDDAVLKNIRLLPIQSLSLYEQYDDQRVAKLVRKIREDEVFFNPITVATWDGKGDSLLIVVDGVNRLEALRRLGAERVVCLVFDYRQIDLKPNIQYIQEDGTVTRASEFITGRGERRDFPPVTREDVVCHIRQGKMMPSGATWHTPPCSVVRLRVPLSLLLPGAVNSEEFAEMVKEAAAQGKMRYIPSNVYICDEW